jgi:hypothetical protein
VPDELATSSALLSTGIAMIAVFLALRQWYERRAREPDLSPTDRRHFVRQDIRRGLGVVVMLVLAIAVYIGSRIAPKVGGAGGAANLAFVQIWLAVSGLIVVMLCLALFDWVATRTYARRQRQYLAAERLRILEAALPKEPLDGSTDSEHLLD